MSFGGDDLVGTTCFTSATRVVVPTDRETGGTGLLVPEAAAFWGELKIKIRVSCFNLHIVHF